MPQELNKIWNAGKLFEPKPEETPKPTPDSAEPNPSTVKRKKSVIGAFIDKQEDPFKERVEAVLKGIEPDLVLSEPKDSAPAMAGKEEKAPDTENLESNGIVIVGPLEGEFDPKFFSDSNKSARLSVWGSFISKIPKSARNVSEQPSAVIASYTLKKGMMDSEIRAELPKNHVFAEDDLWMIADLIKKQPNGESGELLANGSSNFFYFQADASVLVVNMHWNGSEWYVLDLALGDGGQWFKGSQAFSRNG
ncbi:MAG: hypothetical protein WC878_06840 [Candidatus Paceibacterota bacterium]|jgi:hypothetical protein